MTEASCRTEHNRWSVVPADASVVDALASATGLSAVTARILVSRGITTAEATHRFLVPSLDTDWVGTGEIAGMAQAAERVSAAIDRGERIVVFGDFDLDGISAAATATLGLRALGAQAEPVVPHRFREGYGLSVTAMERALEHAPDLVITVDCGISSAHEVAWLKGRGVDVVVTDHHEPGALLPTDVAVANPKLADGGPALSGAGVALALVRAVGELRGDEAVWRTLTDLAMLGTVADIVPLTGSNRALVADGLSAVRRGSRAGLIALAEVAGVPLEGLDAERVAYSLAPRLNAAGRMADPDVALHLLMGEDARQAGTLAHALDEHNRVRQAAENDLFEAALAQAATVFRPGDRVLVVAGEAWHEGVRGIVASRLVGRFGVPALVFCIEGDEAQGSGRSVEGVDLFAALESLSDLLTRFGGHAMAVGATLPAASLGQLRDGLSAHLEELPAATFMKAVPVDAEVPLGALSRELAAELALLGPFGFGNRRPFLASRGIFMNGRKKVGKTEDHLRFTAFDGAASLGAIAFRCADIDRLAGTDTATDIVYELDRDEWRGEERLQLLVRDIHIRAGESGAPAAALVEELFEHAEEILARGEYAGITEAERFHTKVAGVSHEGRQEIAARLQPGTPLRLEREPGNPHDEHACAVFDPFGDKLGYLNRRLAAVLAPAIDAGIEYDVEVADVTGGAEGASFGVNLLLMRRGAAAEANAEAVEMARQRRSELAALSPDALDDALRQHFLGDGRLHTAQAEALEHLAQGRSTLAVMATGRGKSLIFHLHAAREIIAHGRAAVFVYPLRALVADQAFHLGAAFAEIGCSVETLTGESAPSSRDAAFAALGDGSLDVVLTTPEFLDFHAARFAATGRIGFVVVDEAHHVGLARAGHRPSYARLDRALDTLGHPTVLAVTATAPDEVAEQIQTVLGTTAIVLDPTVRDNLRITDERNAPDKDARVATLAAGGEKVIVYVNSRDTSVKLARRLRTRVPDLLHRVAFYNGGMGREARHAVERAFRQGDLSVVVATSAFGEGINIPDVRHVVLYHLPMGEVEFNQLCGRGGRDGKPSSVHLLFGAGDARLNRMILESGAPSREDLGALYLALRDLASGEEALEITNAELAARVKTRRPSATLNERGVSTGIGVFRELGLVGSEGTGGYRRLTLLPAPAQKLDLTSSVRYAEGVEEIEDFEAFRVRALETPAADLLQAFNRPILPTRYAAASDAL